MHPLAFPTCQCGSVIGFHPDLQVWTTGLAITEHPAYGDLLADDRVGADHCSGGLCCGVVLNVVDGLGKFQYKPGDWLPVLLHHKTLSSIQPVNQLFGNGFQRLVIVTFLDRRPLLVDAQQRRPPTRFRKEEARASK